MTITNSAQRPLAWTFAEGRCAAAGSESLSFWEPGFEHGMALFETLLCASGRPVSFDLHLGRLRKSCEALMLIFPPEQELRRACEALLEYAGTCRVSLSPVPFARMKMLVWVSSRSSDPLQPDSTRFALHLEELDASFVGSCRPSRLKPVPDPRSSLLRAHKTTNYWPSFLSLRQARQAGFDDVLFVDPAGCLQESHAASLVWQRKGDPETLIVRDIDAHALPSVTVSRLVRYWEERGRLVSFDSVSIADLKSEVASMVLVSSLQMARPVSAVGDVNLELDAGVSLSKELNDLLRRDWV